MRPTSKEIQTSSPTDFVSLKQRGARRAVHPDLKSRILNLVTSDQRVADVAKAYGLHPIFIKFPEKI